MKELMYIAWNNGVHYLLMLKFFKKAYNNREKLREDYRQTGEYNLLWGMLHNQLNRDFTLNDVTCDYGDEYFYKKHFVSDSKEDMYKLAFKWAKTNPNHNRYYHFIEGAKEINPSGSSQCKIKSSPGTWRTFTTENGKHGKIINWDKSNFGYQDFKFDLLFADGRTESSRRKSTCLPRKVGNKIIVKTKRIGTEHALPQIQNARFKFDYELNKEGYNEWLKKNWIYTNL